MKRLYQVLMGFILFAVLTPEAVFASGDVGVALPRRLSVEEVSAEPGEEVQVALTLSENLMGICGATLTVSYDENLVLKGVSKGTGLSTLTMTKPGDLAANPINIVWDGEKEDTSEGEVAILTFAAPEQAGTYPIVLTYEEGDIIDGDLIPVYLLIQNGNITVVDSRTDEEKAAEFTELINTLDGSNKESIQNTIKAYNLLTDEQKALLAPEVLEKLEAARQDLDAATAVENYIKVLSVDEESSITSARETYEALSENQKKLVDPDLLKKLEDAEKALEEAELKRQADQKAADEVSAIINAMDATDKASVAAAREQYDALTDDQRALIDQEVLKKLTNAEEPIRNQEAADEVSAAINAMDVTDKASVAAARELYDTLTDDQRALVDQAVLKKLTDAEEAIRNQEAADGVTAAINTMDTTDKASVTAVREKYDALSDDQKALVDQTVLKKLTDAEEAIRNQEAADEVSAVINAINVTDKASMAAAREQYDALTNDQKVLVDAALLKKLTDAEEAILAADTVVDVINSMDARKRDSVAAARAKYDKLTDEQKKLIDTAVFKKLTDAEASIREEDQKAAADKAAADNVNSLIKKASTSDPASIEKARNAYDKLTDNQKALIDKGTLNQLEKNEQVIKENREAADKVTELIISLPEVITSKDEEAVQDAQKAYDALTDEQKKLVPGDTIEKLKAAEKVVKDKKAAGKVVELINALPLNAGSENEAEVKTARKALDSLTDEQKKLVPAEVQEKLTDAEEFVQEDKRDSTSKEKARKSEEKIDKIPDADNVTLEDKQSVEEAVKEYKALTDAQKKRISAEKKAKLSAAEEKIEDLAGHKTLADTEKDMLAGGEEGSKKAAYLPLAAQIKSVKKKSLKVQWKPVSEADGYIIYANRCKKKYKLTEVARITKPTAKSFTLKKIDGKALKKNTYYKVVVAAYKTTTGGTDRVLAISKTIHAATSGGKNGNPAKLTVNKKKVTVKVKKTVKLKVKQKAKKGTKITKHRKIMFESSNPKIATVSKKGVIKGKKKGSCKIYAYAQNGLSATIKVKVKK